MDEQEHEDLMRDTLTDLAERLKKAEASLMAKRLEHWQASERSRIFGKAQGVRLALSYVEEYLR